MSSRRLPAGGDLIDRSRPVPFTFEGRALSGFAGDTLASALLANGVDVVCTSPIQGRPRGVFAAGVEEPCAFVEVRAPSFEPIVPATTVELVDGLVATGRPGVGRLPVDGPSPVPTRHRHAHVETLVVGAGSAGVRAALGALRTGDRVMLVDERGAPTDNELAASPDCTALVRATALGIYDDGYAVIFERSRPIANVWHVRARRIVLATGAHERPIAFADNDRPGVMLASAAVRYAERYGVLVGDRAVVFTTNPSGHEAATALEGAGMEIVAVLDVSSGWAVTGTDGDPRVTSVHAAGPGGATEHFDADLLLVAGGWNPAVQLWRAIGGSLRYDEERACFIPDSGGPSWLEVAGAAAGEGIPGVTPYWYTPADDLSHHYVDLQRDSTVADVLEAVAHELHSAEHVKRATYIGTAIDQGRTSGVLTAAIVNNAWGSSPGAQGPTNARPPYTPVPFAALAGLDRGPHLLDPVRITPIHTRHVERGAVFENVGQWKRPWYFPADPLEDIDAAVRRECLAVRQRAGVMDATTLGKIELRGPDAGTFLDRLYTNAMSSLPVGSIRYGLMLGLDGMVFDDGVAMRLAEDRYLITTTTGGAARVMDHVEEWLQTEWPELRVYATSVTEQWATIAVNGPRARDVLAGAETDIDLRADAFPFMTWRAGTVAGMAARVARVSFSGELAYEINVPGTDGTDMWEAVMAAGAPFGLAPYGTETMHVLRAEKGFVIVGQDTDGTVTPHDLGMSWIVNETKGDFIGRRSLRRPDLVRPDRKHLVGLLPQDPDALLPEGAQLVLRDTGIFPMPMVGHVTSSYRSAALDRTFALAMLERGRELHGTTVFAPLIGGTIPATVTASALYDPQGARRDG
jgi:sarcosine oxidase subunit alpha